MQRWFRLLSTVALALTLAACKIDASVDVAVEPNGSGSVTVRVTADAEAVAEAPGLAEDLRLDDLRTAGWQISGPTAADGGGLTIELVRPFATVAEANDILEELSGPDGVFGDLLISQRRAFAKVVTRVDGHLRVAGGMSSFADADLLAAVGGRLPYEATLTERGLTLADALSIRFAVSVPGRPVLTDGFASPATGQGFDLRSTIDWTVDIAGAASTQAGQAVTLESRIEDGAARRADRLRAAAPWALAAWLVLFLLVIVPITLLVRRRHRGT